MKRTVTYATEDPAREYPLCSACGACAERIVCESCDGEGIDAFAHDCGEDTCCCLHPEPNVTCNVCEGEGGWWRCEECDP